MFFTLQVGSTDTVTCGHIVNSVPFKNTVDLVELKGKDLVQVFEQVASMYDETKPSDSFLQFSGISRHYSEDERPNHTTLTNKQNRNITVLKARRE